MDAIEDLADAYGAAAAHALNNPTTIDVEVKSTERGPGSLPKEFFMLSPEHSGTVGDRMVEEGFATKFQLEERPCYELTGAGERLGWHYMLMDYE